MLKGFGYATIAIGCLSAAVAFIWGLISAFSAGAFLALAAILGSLVAAGAILVLFVGNGLMMIKVDALVRSSDASQSTKPTESTSGKRDAAIALIVVLAIAVLVAVIALIVL